MSALSRNISAFDEVIEAISQANAQVHILAPTPCRSSGQKRQRNALVSPENHGYFELLICIAGRMKLVGYSSAIELEKGDTVLVKPGAWHYESYSHTQQPYRACWLSAPERLTYYFFTHYVRRSFKIVSSGASPRLNEAMILEATARELDERPIHWRAKVQSLLLNLLVDFDRRKLGEEPNIGLQELDPVQKLLRIVNSRFREPLQIQLLAKEIGISSDHLGRRFHSSCGVTFKDHLNAIRVHHAKHLLTSGRPIKEVAEECGFSDIHYFGRVFKERCKISPGRFLRES